MDSGLSELCVSGHNRAWMVDARQHLSEIQESSLEHEREATRLRERAKALRSEAKRLDAKADELECIAADGFEHLLATATALLKGAGKEYVAPTRTRFDKIRGALQRRAGQDVTVEQIRKAIGEGTSAKNSVRATLAIMVRKGEIERRGRGVYRLKETD